MKAAYFGLALLLVVASCSHPFGPDPQGSSAEDLLYEAYQEQSVEKLRTFFETWEGNVQSISEKEFDALSELQQAIYSLYETFYDPRFPSKLGGSEWGDGIYRDAEYFIVQNKLYFRPSPDPGNMDRSRFDSDEEFFEYIDRRDSLSNFRPRLSFPETDVVYLTEEYESLITDFLLVAHPDDAPEWEEDELRQERQKRLAFINEMATIIPGHWFGWHVLTHPEADVVEIDPGLTRAHVPYRIVYQGGYANYVREEGDWTLVEARLIWIE